MDSESAKIEIEVNGPYHVQGRVPLVRKSPIISEHGEPMSWRTGDAVAGGTTYLLCRCGQSRNKPFCDGSHARTGFDGTETAATAPIATRQEHLPGTGIELRDASELCVHAGFCGNHVTDVWTMVKETEDTLVRAQLMAMIERCPSGRLSYALAAGAEAVEPDLPVQIALIPDGPLWVTGRIAVTRSDGTPCERRNRVTLCRCGGSKNKPFCDGTHAEIGFSDAAPTDQADPSRAADGRTVPEGADSTPLPSDDPPATEVEAGRYLRYMADFIGFTSDDAEAVRQTKWIIEKHLPDIVADFYDKLLSYPPTRRFFLAPDRTIDQEYLELRMRHQVSFWLHAADGLLDDEFARYVDFVGQAHTARGADPSIYIAERYVIGMVGFVQHAISRAMLAELRSHADQAFADEAQEAWDKLVMVILELLSRAYGNERSAETFEPLVSVDRAAVAAAADRAFAAQQAAPQSGVRRDVWVAKAADIADGERRILRVEGRSVGIFHAGGNWYAVRNYCLHRGGPVATGTLDGCVLTCPWHGYRYDIATGACLADPLAQLETFPVIVRDGEVYVQVPETAETDA